MDRKQAVLVAGTFTGLVLVTILSLGFGKVRAQPAGDASVSLATAGMPAPEPSDTEIGQQLQDLQMYSARLEQTVLIMQEREKQYQRQLDSANRIITQLQNEVNRANSGRSARFFEESEEHESGRFDD